jgi:hypothetical protein
MQILLILLRAHNLMVGYCQVADFFVYGHLGLVGCNIAL